MKKIILGILLVILLVGCKPTRTITNTVIETRTDTITMVETIKSEPIVDSIVIIKKIVKDKPIYYRDKHWEMTFNVKNDSLFAEIKHLTDSIDHLHTKTTVNNFKSEKTQEVIKEKDYKLPFILMIIIVILVFVIVLGYKLK